MPYQGERAHPQGYRAVAVSELIASSVARFAVVDNEAEQSEDILDLCTPIDALPETVPLEDIDRVFSLDASVQDVALDASRRPPVCGFIQLGAVMMNMPEIRRLAGVRFIDPVEERASRPAHQLVGAVPGWRIRLPGLSRWETWRSCLDFLINTMVADLEPFGITGGRQVTLAEALLVLFGKPGDPADKVPVRHCPSCHAEGTAVDPLTYVTLQGGTCPKPDCGATLYLVDALGVGVTLATSSSRQSATSQAMSVVEKLASVAFLEAMRSVSLEFLTRTLVVLDGPMAVFGEAQAMTYLMRDYLSELGRETLALGLPMPLIVGVEKSGDFAEHLLEIEDLIPIRSVMSITDDYIAEYLKGPGREAYGRRQLYGRRFFYRRATGEVITITTPALPDIAPYSAQKESEEIESYPNLRSILALLDSLGSSALENAVLPLVYAHQACSLPLGAGSRILTRRAQELMGLETRTATRDVRPF